MTPLVLKNQITRPKSKVNPKYIQLLGIGTSLPASSIPQKETAQLAKGLNCKTPRQERLLEVLYDRTRVGSRSSVFRRDGVLSGSFESFFPKASNGHAFHGPSTHERMTRYNEEAPGLAFNAAQKALGNTNRDLGDIGHLITVSCTGFAAPGFDIKLIKQLGLSPEIQRTHIGFMGCHGMFNALRVGQSLVRQNPKQKVLLCSVELCSIHFAYGWDPDQIVANALFADGASAALIGMEENKKSHWSLEASGSYLFPESEDVMTWKVGDHGFVMNLSAKVPGLIEEHLKPWLESWLHQQGLGLSDIQSWAIHPGGPRILDAVGKALGLAEDAMAVSRDILSKHGNMSSATLLFILKALQQMKAPGPCVALGFGPGLTCEAALLV